MNNIVKWIFLLLILLAFSCQQFKKIISNQTPREQFLASLQQTTLFDKQFVRSWEQAWESAISNPANIELPYREKSIFFPNETDASGLQFTAKRGEIVIIQILADFELYAELRSTTYKKPLANLEKDQFSFEYEVEENATFTLCIQPELFSGGSYEIIITKGPSVDFPVSGNNSSATQSFWGAGRDGGSRKHEGIDIFAPRGTPVVAVVPGIVRAGNNNLGGKVVWLSQATKGRSFYYAHLDSQLVSTGFVKTGDTLGLVGNSGNARYTKPHLHFGIYLSGLGAVDPFPFVNNVKPPVKEVTADTSLNGEYALISVSEANVRNIPSTKGAVDTLLKKNILFKVKAATSDWYRIEFPNGKEAYIHSSLVSKVKNIPGIRESKKHIAFIDPWKENTKLDSVLVNQNTEVYGSFADYSLIKHPCGNLIWITD